jgi:hypothetical protein
MAEIKIKEIGSDTTEMAFQVEVVEGGSSTSHRVTLDREYCESLTEGKVVPPRLVEVSFIFLLERESKESILSTFNLSVIPRYFADYEREIRRYF